VAEWYGAGLATARSRVRIPPTAAVYLRQLSVPSLRGRLMSTSESWGVNGHTTQCTGPVCVVLRLRLVSGWGLWNGDQRRPMSLKARERTLLYLTTNERSLVLCSRDCLESLTNCSSRLNFDSKRCRFITDKRTHIPRNANDHASAGTVNSLGQAIGETVIQWSSIVHGPHMFSN